MRSVVIFGEDYAHQVTLRALVHRVADAVSLSVDIRVRSSTGGHGKVLSELAEYVAELAKGQAALPDLFVVALDANCRGYAEKAREIQRHLEDYTAATVCAIPDPHIERWLLLDSAAFKTVLGQGCKPPDAKCERYRYKLLLEEAVRAADIDPPLGGIEFAEDLVAAMNLDRCAKIDASFGHLLRDLRSGFAGLNS